MQLYDKKTEQMWAAEASIKLLLNNPSKEMAVLIKEAQEQYDSNYLSTRVCQIAIVFSVCTRVRFPV